jgi:hypothetical protein
METYFKITKQGNQYIISIGTGKVHKVNSLQEVVFGLQHYFQESIPAYPFGEHYVKANNPDTGQPVCPFCNKQ